MAKYYTCGGSESHWRPTNAKTLEGAKTIAGKTYQYAVGGKVEIAELVTYSNGEREYVPVSVKYGWDNWQQA